MYYILAIISLQNLSEVALFNDSFLETGMSRENLLWKYYEET